jgi:NADH-quinone oxidoreductase subunit C
MSNTDKEKNEKLLALLRSKLGQQLLSSELNLGDVVIVVDSTQIFSLLRLLKIDSELYFDLFLNVTAVDWMDKKPKRFELVYHLLSTKNQQRIRIKTDVAEEKPEVDSVVALWSGANFMEREVWDMYGIKFNGHPDLRRILMYDEFVGYPLRKDYPLQGKQPRIPLRAPEVTNTARQMLRPELVKIGGRQNKSV